VRQRDHLVAEVDPDPRAVGETRAHGALQIWLMYAEEWRMTRLGKLTEKKPSIASGRIKLHIIRGVRNLFVEILNPLTENLLEIFRLLILRLRLM
jgi:hypothetical protein